LIFNLKTKSTCLAGSKPSSIWLLEWAGNGQATLTLCFEFCNSRTKSAWLAHSNHFSMWPPERAGNLDPALLMFQFENQISMVGSSQAFLDLAFWSGKQP
jgi:hypothetical protein